MSKGKGKVKWDTIILLQRLRGLGNFRPLSSIALLTKLLIKGLTPMG